MNVLLQLIGVMGLIIAVAAGINVIYTVFERGLKNKEKK